MQQRLVGGVAAAVLILILTLSRHGGGGGGMDVAWAGRCQMGPLPSATDKLIVSEFPCCSTFESQFVSLRVHDSHRHPHITLTPDHLLASLVLDDRAGPNGTGFKSKMSYMTGFFSVAIKLPTNTYTAGVVTTFKISNYETYPYQKDEVEFDFLGRTIGEEHILQTNVYVNDSNNMGKEQRLRLWFDPTMEYHNYSISWTSNHIMLYVDGIPIREVSRNQLHNMFPLKPMYVYGIIWDGSDWATHGGNYKVNFTYGPFIATYGKFILNGCRYNITKPTHARENLDCDNEFSLLIPNTLTRQQRRTISWVQRNYMTYNYCDDTQRYPSNPPECASSHHIEDEL